MLDLIVAVSIIIISSAIIAYVAWVFRRSTHLERDYVRALEESAPA